MILLVEKFWLSVIICKFAKTESATFYIRTVSQVGLLLIMV